MNGPGRWLVGLLALGRAALKHDFVEGLIAAQDALGGPAFQRLADRMAASPSGQTLLRDRPRIGVVQNVERLQQMPRGTFGREVWQHMSDHDLLRDPVIPESRYPESDEARYAKSRWRETHDVRHVLTGLAPVVPDETLLHAFQLGQHFNPFSLVIVLFGPLYGWRDESPIVTWSRVPEAYEVGRAAALTAVFPYEEHMATPLDEVHRLLGMRSLAHLSCRAPAPVPAREGRNLVLATKPYAREQRGRTWWELGVTLLSYAVGLALAVLGPAWPIQAVGSVLLALTSMRLFSFLHDFEHGAIFRGSRAGLVVIEAIGVLTCIPPRVWREFHNRHHRTTGVALPAQQKDLRGGDFINRIVDADAWSQWSVGRRRTYRFVRHPVTMILGWFVNHVLGACITQLMRDPRGNRSAAFTLAAHLAWLGSLAAVFGLEVFVFVGVLPTVLGSTIGTWLIYIQHSFPGVVYQRGAKWDYVSAAIQGSSFYDLPPGLRWFSGNLGYHHVHHLNPRIPFYRLPEVMSALPETHAAGRITLSWRDTVACLRIHAWDPRGDVAGPLPE